MKDLIINSLSKLQESTYLFEKDSKKLTDYGKKIGNLGKQLKRKRSPA